MHQLPFPMLYAALQSGQFEGQENPIATIISSKFYQVQNYLTLSGHVYDPAILFMAVDSFGDLSADDKNSFIEAAKLAGRLRAGCCYGPERRRRAAGEIGHAGCHRD